MSLFLCLSARLQETPPHLHTRSLSPLRSHQADTGHPHPPTPSIITIMQIIFIFDCRLICIISAQLVLAADRLGSLICISAPS